MICETYVIFEGIWNTYVRHMSSADAYVLYAVRGRGIVAVILHVFTGLYIKLLILYAYLIVILYIIYIECYMHDYQRVDNKACSHYCPFLFAFFG